MTIIITIKIEDSISAADSTTRDSSYIKEGFRYRVSFMKTGVGEEKKNLGKRKGRERFPKTEQVRRNIKV